MTIFIPWVGSGFKPTDLTGCALWLDAADGSTITLATGVSAWADKSGAGHHLSQATGSLQPGIVSAGLGGLDFVRFDGTDDRLSAAWASQATPVTAVGVSRIRSNDIYANPLGVIGDGNLGSAIAFGLDAAGTAYRQVAGTSHAGSAATNNVWYVFTNVLNGAASFARANGSSIISVGNAGSATASTFNLGANSGPTRWDTIDVAEIIWYASALSAAEYAAVEAYLAAKWGL